MSLVQKYGADYLKNIDDMIRIADYVAEHKEQLEGLVLVTAAMHDIRKILVQFDSRFMFFHEFLHGMGNMNLGWL